MHWIIRLLGLVLALTATASVLVMMPVGAHDGITPIHCTTIDVVVSGIGYFVLFMGIIGVLVEQAIAMLQRPTIMRDDRIPIARVVR